MAEMSDAEKFCVRCGAPYLAHGQCSRFAEGCQGGIGEYVSPKQSTDAEKLLDAYRDAVVAQCEAESNHRLTWSQRHRFVVNMSDARQAIAQHLAAQEREYIELNDAYKRTRIALATKHSELEAKDREIARYREAIVQACGHHDDRFKEQAETMQQTLKAALQ